MNNDIKNNNPYPHPAERVGERGGEVARYGMRAI